MLTVATQQSDIILPGAAELVWGGVVFLAVAAVLVAGVFLAVRAASRRSGGGSVDHWRERALRAEAQLELLRQQREDADGPRR